LAYILAAAVGSQIHTLSGPQIERPGDLTGVLTNLQHGDVLFIDEIHRLHPKIEEFLYPAMEDFRVDIMIDQGPNARSIPLTLNRFTLVGATTRSGLLTAPLRTRMGITCRLDYYEPPDLAAIIERSAGLLDIQLEHGGALEIARRSRGTPRVANKLLSHVRDFAQIRADNVITTKVADAALSMIDIDADGLDEMDKRILEAMVFKFQGGPVGLGTIAVAVAEDATTIEEVHEPYLILKGFCKRTPRGRVAMPAAYAKLGASPPVAAQPELF
jgi:Holliday junction DNA helicase RuvB